MIQRKCVIAYFENKDALKIITPQVGTIYYVSERSGYAIIYCDFNRYKGLCQLLTIENGFKGYEDSKLDVEKHSF